MKNRTIKELLIFLKDNKDYFKKSRCGGLCVMANWLRMDGMIKQEEYNTIKHYLFHNLPKKKYAAYCWPEYEWQPRKKWLNEQINSL